MVGDASGAKACCFPTLHLLSKLWRVPLRFRGVRFQLATVVHCFANGAATVGWVKASFSELATHHCLPTKTCRLVRFAADGGRRQRR